MTVAASLQAVGTIESAGGLRFNEISNDCLPEVAAEEADAVAAAEVAAEAAADVAAAVDAAETPETAAAISSTPCQGKSGPALAIEEKEPGAYRR